MRETDYSRIAHKYDRNKYRQKIGQDIFLKAYIEENRRLEYDILDLACGTGIYLRKQMDFFADENIRWHGLDASVDMLELAREKVPKALLVNGLAENLPYESNKFDFIVNNYAFQHFIKKAEALDEIARVLKTGGVFEMHNIAIHQMRSWWVYKYFPSAYFEDLKRFWDKDLLFHELSVRGFDVELNIKYQMQYSRIDDLLEYGKNRDISVLTLIDEEEYLRGMEIMNLDLGNDRNKRIVCDYAELYCIAKRL